MENKKSKAVIEWRRRAKAKAVALKGGQCSLCGYKKNYASLEFHHLDPAKKEFGFGLNGVPRSWDRMLVELEKCVLICSNCHGEIHEREPVKTQKKYDLIGRCKVHGETEMRFHSRGKKRKPTLSCVKCSRERMRNLDVKKKMMVIEALGSKCSICSYSKSRMSLDAHHLGDKKYNICGLRNVAKILEEIKKCVLLCRNCHKEQHHPHLNMPE